MITKRSQEPQITQQCKLLDVKQRKLTQINVTQSVYLLHTDSP